MLNEFRAQAADESKKYALVDSLEVANNRITKLENSIARAYGGLMVVSFIGVANFVKIWTGG